MFTFCHSSEYPERNVRAPFLYSGPVHFAPLLSPSFRRVVSSFNLPPPLPRDCDSGRVHSLPLARCCVGTLRSGYSCERQNVNIHVTNDYILQGDQAPCGPSFYTFVKCSDVRWAVTVAALAPNWITGCSCLDVNNM